MPVDRVVSVSGTERGHDTHPSRVHIATWRVGRKVGRTIYAQLGAEPSDDDPLIGVMDTPSLARAVVTAANGDARLRDEVERETQLRRDAEHHLADLKAYCDRQPYPDEVERLLNALAELVDLKDGPRDHAYRAAKDAAWERARAIVRATRRCICLPRPYDEDPDCPLHGGS